MYSTTIPFQLQLSDDVPFAFSVQALANRLEELTDQRKRRGVRYPLAVLLTLAVLAKLFWRSMVKPCVGPSRPARPAACIWSRPIFLRPAWS